MATTLTLNQLCPLTPHLEEHLQRIISQIALDPYAEDFARTARRIADLAFGTDWNFIMTMMKTNPMLATAAVFAAYGNAQSQGMGWINKHLIPHIRNEEAAIRFSDPNRFSEFATEETAPWTFDKIARAADVQACFEGFKAEQDAGAGASEATVVFDGEEYVVQ